MQRVSHYHQYPLITYLTFNGFEVEMTLEGFKQFEADNQENIKVLNEKSTDTLSYYETETLEDRVKVRVLYSPQINGSLQYVEHNYFKIVFRAGEE